MVRWRVPYQGDGRVIKKGIYYDDLQIFIFLKVNIDCNCIRFCKQFFFCLCRLRDKGGLSEFQCLDWSERFDERSVLDVERS